jgi:hypothetical protein
MCGFTGVFIKFIGLIGYGFSVIITPTEDLLELERVWGIICPL